MNYIKKHKTPFIVLVLLFILVIFMSIYIFFYQTNSNKYGNRLNGIENVHINESKIVLIKYNRHITNIIQKIEKQIINLFRIIKSFIFFNTIIQTINEIKYPIKVAIAAPSIPIFFIKI